MLHGKSQISVVQCTKVGQVFMKIGVISMNGQKKLIGVCGVRMHEQYTMPFIQAIKQGCENRGYHMIVFSGTSNNLEDTDEIIGQHEFVELIRHVDICALVIMAETIKNESLINKLLQLGKEKNIPVFSQDRKIEGCYNLLMDNQSCFEQIVRHVVEEHGCRCINMIAGIKGHRFSDERIDIYRRVLKEHGIPVEEERIGYGEYWEDPAAEVIEKFLSSKLPFPQAIVCANDIMANGAITRLNERGYEVPEDVLVTGYDNTKDGSYFLPSITTGGANTQEMVERIFTEIAKYMETGEIVPTDIIVPVIMKIRQSCGCKNKIVPKNARRISKLMTEKGSSKWHMQAMNLMLSDSFGKKDIKDIVPIIQKHMERWFKFYRHVCVKEELIRSNEVSKEDTKVTSILAASRGKFSKVGVHSDISDIQSYIEGIIDEEKFNTILVHPLISGKDVYGFSVEGFEELEDWQMKQCDEFAMFLSHIVHSVVYNKKMYEMNEDLYQINEEMRKMSLCDSMTGIYNRRGFFQSIKKIIQKKENQGKYLYLFMVDMDGLKYINDNFSHAEGDFAIITLANALVEMGTPDSVCARIGGDEFICAYVENKTGCYTAEEFTAQIDCLIKKAKGMDEKEYPVSASVGMMTEQISENFDIDAVINRADDKMYVRKVARKTKRTDS